jgi:TolB protein
MHCRRPPVPLFSLLLLFAGLFASGGCASLDAQPPTLAALLTLPVEARATSEPTSTPVPATRMNAATSARPLPTISSLREPPDKYAPTPAHGPDDSTPYPWLLAYDSDAEGNDEIYLVPAAGPSAVNITNHPSEDRHPSWSPDGGRLAFQSNRDGNWEIYTLDLNSGELRRLTSDRAYDGAPSWSPDGDWIVFASYRDVAPCDSSSPTKEPPTCPDLEVYRIPAAGGPPQRLTQSPGGDSDPVFSPDGDWIAFTSWRTGDKEILVMPAAGGSARQVSTSAGDDWAPSWSPDGSAIIFLSDRAGVANLFRQPLDGGPVEGLTGNDVPAERPTFWADGSLLYARYEPGPPFEADDPIRPGAYRLYRQLADSAQTQPLSLPINARRPAAAPLADLSAATIGVFTGAPPARTVAAVSAPHLDLVRLEDIAAPDPRLVKGVDKALRSWRDAVYTKSGHDFLGRYSDVFRPAAYYNHRLGYLSWHKAGRAVDLLFDWRAANGAAAQFVVREDLRGQVYWRLYLKCTSQDGSMGEPLTQAPWHFWWHPDPAKSLATIADGGRRLPIPSGYFVDVTTLAERYGWSRIASYHLDDFHWKRDSTATEYWHYQHTDGLTWYEAMSQLYPQELLEELFSRPVSAARGQTEAVMDGKGLPPADPPPVGARQIRAVAARHTPQRPQSRAFAVHNSAAR